MTSTTASPPPDPAHLDAVGWHAVDPGAVARTLDDAAGGGAYRVSVRWPREPAPAAGWPLVLLLDDDFGDLAWTLWRHHAQGRRGPTIRDGVLVSVGYPGPSRREQDYVPALAPGDTGRAGPFLAFLRTQVLPAVAAAWPVDPAQVTLAGHSLGGLFVVDALLREPQAFAHWVAISPSVWWGGGHLARLAAARAGRALPRPATTLIFVGEHEQALAPDEAGLPLAERERIAARRAERRMVDGARELAGLLGQMPSLDVSFVCLAGEGHRSLVPRALELALRSLYARRQ